MKSVRILNIILCSLLLMACGHRVTNPKKVARQPDIYPDYVGVTIPVGVAPLDFAMADESVKRIDVVARGSQGGEMHANGE